MAFLLNMLGSNDPVLGLKGLANQEVLKINNELNCLFSNRSKKYQVETPVLVTVGMQSAGKSSLFGTIMGMDALPVGKLMTTRTPVQLMLVHTPTMVDTLVEFGSQLEGNWKTEKSFKVTSDRKENKQEFDKIRKEIEAQTELKAGNGKNISYEPIIIKISSANVPDLTLIDLPGLVSIACTDKNQPKDIKEQIQNLVGSYIKSERTIIVAVMAARSDLETDMALELIKKYDENFDRTVGVITKVDLMDSETDISNYLSGNISQSLKFKYGYYAVKNRSNSEMETKSVQDGLNAEKTYFGDHKIYSKVEEQKRLGVPNLVNDLSSILVNHIKKYLPDVFNELNQMQIEVEKLLVDLGPALPYEAEGKAALLNNILSNFSKNVTNAFEERCNSYNSGRDVKDILDKYRDVVEKTEPFNTSLYPDDYIVSAIKNCEGNHMSFIMPSIDSIILEYCIKDTNKKPFQVLKPISILCVKEVVNQIMMLTNKLLLQENISRFPKLLPKIKESVNSLIAKYQEDVYRRIDDLLRQEESYVYTHDKVFWKDVNVIITEHLKSGNKTSASLIRSLLQKYFTTVKNNFQNNVPKMIMTYLVHELENNLYNTLFEKLSKQSVVAELLCESMEQMNKRKLYDQQKVKIDNAKKKLELIR